MKMNSFFIFLPLSSKVLLYLQHSPIPFAELTRCTPPLMFNPHNHPHPLHPSSCPSEGLTWSWEWQTNSIQTHLISPPSRKLVPTSASPPFPSIFPAKMTIMHQVYRKTDETSSVDKTILFGSTLGFIYFFAGVGGWVVQRAWCSGTPSQLSQRHPVSCSLSLKATDSNPTFRFIFS